MDAASIYQVLAIAALFCVASSAAYIVNDICDIERDRNHPTKSKTRPLASGAVSIKSALILLACLYAILIYGWFHLPDAMLIVVAYLVLNLVYSHVLKHKPVIDIFTIALGFVLRVYAGAVALSVPMSSWMFVTTLCLALYLAAIKRRQELKQSGSDGRKVLSQYSLPLVERYAEMSATGALLFYSIFVMSDKPELVVTIPLVLFGLFRYWFIVEALELGESPTDALFTDRQLQATVAIWLTVCIWALWPMQR